MQPLWGDFNMTHELQRPLRLLPRKVHTTLTSRRSCGCPANTGRDFLMKRLARLRSMSRLSAAFSRVAAMARKSKKPPTLKREAFCNGHCARHAPFI
jgi:hypothetical protein